MTWQPRLHEILVADSFSANVLSSLGYVMMFHRRFFLTGIVTCAIILQTLAGHSAELTDSEKSDFFEKRIRPVLVQHCYKCHSTDSKQAKGGLRLDSREAIRKGGDSGPAVIPGDTEESLLLQALAYDGSFYDMPPAGKLSDAQIADLSQWIQDGAYDPRRATATTENITDNRKSAQNHWAFQPIRPQAVPQVKNSQWPKSDLDRFILHRIEEKGLNPAPAADRLTWLRRVWFDLVGLPPTVEAIKNYLADTSPQQKARAKIVDDLLSRSQFGERWGQHWLDVARFAESSGGGRTLLFKDAWRYRDYVINALNADMPYNQFLREQIAGDLLPAGSEEDRARQVTATGFLVLGPTNYEEQDKYLLRMDIVDEQLDTLGRTTMGMTLGCARCHDHKFDPIPTRDYYALAGILRSTRTLFNDTDNVARWIDAPLPMDAETLSQFKVHEQKLSHLQTQIKAVREELFRLDPKTAQLAKEGPVKPESLPGLVIDDSQAKAVGGWKTSTFGNRYLGENASYDQKSKKGPSSMTFDPEIKKSGRYDVRLAFVSHENRATNTPVTILHAAGEELKRINQREEPPIEGRFISLGTYRFEAGGAGFVMVSNEGANGAVSVDGVWFYPVDDSDTDDLLADAKSNSIQLTKAKEKLRQLEDQRKELQKQTPLKPLAMSVREHEKIEDSPIHIRGNAKTLGHRVPRAAMSAVASVTFGEIPESQSGRVQLANWLTDTRHPLTSRVIANRVWLWLFGQGLVRTPDNFGTTGQPPTHPELLDYLSDQLVGNQWSIKSLIRSIVLSETYAMSDENRNQSPDADPVNELWTRFPMRRLDAEAIRDSLLSASGTLDLTVCGPNIEGARAIDANDNGAGSIEYNYKFADTRRSVYTPAFRNKRLELFEVFDFADINQPIGQREQSIVATQSLYLMNHPFVTDMAEKTAQRLLAEPLAHDRERLNQLTFWVLSRPATEAEAQVLLPLVQTANSEQLRQQAWARVAHALFASTEFRYIH